MNRLSLEEFIYQVKRELLGAQEMHEGESAFLELQNVELEVSLVVNKKAAGKVDVWVAEFGSDISKERIQKVRLAFKVIDLRSDDTPPQEDSNRARESPRTVSPGRRVFP